MGIKWTKEQQTVINLRNCNILVSAAAGSGKTAVLVERILSMLTDPEDPVDIDRLVIVTFTNAAAGEMRDRIREAIEERLETEENPAVAEHLQRQTALLMNARISTIHSLCQYIIRNYFHTIDLDPDFCVMDEGERKLLESDVLHEVLEEEYAQGSPEYTAFTECISPGRDDRRVEEVILQVQSFSMSFPWPEEWLESCLEVYQAGDPAEFFGLDWARGLARMIKIQLEDVCGQIREAMELAQSPGGPCQYMEALQSDLEHMEKLLLAEDYPGLWDGFDALGGWKALSRKKNGDCQPELQEQVKNLRDQYKKTVERLKTDYFYGTKEQLFGQIRASEPFMRELIRLTKKFLERCQEEKRERNLCDFNDLEHLALKILVKKEQGELVRTPAALELADQYREILIDEYQDSNLVQEMILNSISRIPEGKYNLFMVGDVKQSIYRFRLARPELFMEKFRTYSLTEGPCRRIDLHQNFRSRAQVLESVNVLFHKSMARDLGGVEYDEAARLRAGAEFPREGAPEECRTQILILDPREETGKAVAELKDVRETGAEPEADGEATAGAENARELEARMIAGKIRELVGRYPIWDKALGGYRPARYSDIVILLRTMNGWAEVFARVLGDLGIPCHAGARSGYFSAPEVQTVLALLKIIDNPCQDIPLAAVLYSPIGGLTARELAQIRSADPKEPFYRACRKSERLADFFELLGELRQKAAYMPMQEFLWMVLEQTGYGDFAAAMPGGDQRKANLDMLVQKAAAFEKGSYHGLYHFVRYIENLHKYDVDFGEASGDLQEEDVVRIMSIHKSKGLEFPIVVAAGMGKTINQSDSRSALILDANLGIGCDLTDPIKRLRCPTLYKNYMKQRIKNENLGEELRVLYVALTRAKEKLILTGTLGNAQEKLEKLTLRKQQGGAGERLSYTERISAGTYWDWILPAVYGDPAFETVQMSIKDLIRLEKQRQVDYTLGKEELLALPVSEKFDQEAGKRLREELEYVYPYGETVQIPSKVSVSELKKMGQLMQEDSWQMYEETPPVPLIPEFMKEEKEASGAARGTIYHRVMECMNLEAEAEAELERIVQKGLLTEEERELVDLEKIRSFQKTPLAARMARAQREGCLYREQQFVLEVPASEVWPSFEGTEKVLIQGIIDAFFLEGEEIVLVDYKTDSVKFQEASSLYEKYRVQLEYYKKALERLLQKQVKEQIIYSFCLNRELTGSEQG